MYRKLGYSLVSQIPSCNGLKRRFLHGSVPTYTTQSNLRYRITMVYTFRGEVSLLTHAVPWNNMAYSTLPSTTPPTTPSAIHRFRIHPTSKWFTSPSENESGKAVGYGPRLRCFLGNHTWLACTWDRRMDRRFLGREAG